MAGLINSWDQRMRRELLRSQGRSAALAASVPSVLNSGASEGQITAAEARLGVRLESSYRAFLAVSNGAGASSMGLASSDDPECRFLAVEEIGLVRDLMPELVERWTTLAELNDPSSRPEMPDAESVTVTFYRPLVDGVLISGVSGPNVDVLVPVDGVWQLWVFAWEGAEAYASFDHLLRFMIEDPEPTWTADQLIELIRQGQIQYLLALYETGDERTRDIAVEVLSDEHIFDQLVRGFEARDWINPERTAERERIRAACFVLLTLPDQRSIEPLRAALTRAVTSVEVIGIIMALMKCGAPDTQELLEQAASGERPDDRDRRKLWDWANSALKR